MTVPVRAIRLPRRRLAAALLLALTAPWLAAQDSDPRVMERIEVTGSRIKKAEIEEQVPVQVITREDIDRTGLTSVADVVQLLTASGSALNTKFNSSGNFGFSPNGDGVGAGSAQVDLRHLGSKRVLVLVDGIRWVNESSASGVGASTDLNTIPLALVERVEVLKDGASSIYGSDAIAGVVNIITRRDFDGAEISGYYGEFDGDGETKRGDFSWGGSDGEGLNWFFSASYVEQDPVFSRDREQAAFPVPGTGLTFGSSATPQGRFIFINPVANSACPLVDLDDNPATPPVAFCNITTPNGRTFSPSPSFPGDFIPFSTASRFNFSQFNLVLTPSERSSVFGQFRLPFNDNLTMYAKALYNRRESVNQAAPEPIFLGPDAGTGNPFADNITISRFNQFNPFGIDLGPNNLILVGRRPIEGGPRVFEQDVETLYIGGGLEGSMIWNDSPWYWDVNVMFSNNDARQTNFGSYDIGNINQALGPNALCVAPCVPLNIFGGPGTITPAMLNFIQPVFRDASRNSISLFSANLSGDLFALPAGPLAMATGFEHRRLEGSYNPDPLTVAGRYNGVPSLPTSGEYDVSEVFVEFSVPLIADAPFAKKLDLSLAGRYSDYSTFGGEFTPKYGLRWQVVDEFLVRATFAEGFRAPSIGELFGSAARADLVIDDPCLIGLDGSPPNGNPANCAALGVPGGAAQANSQISVTTGGNAGLEPERADTFTAGFVWSPEFAANGVWSDRLDIEVTYYDQEVQGAIQAIDAQTQLNLCVATLSPQFCNGISRASTGGINGFSNRLTNLGAIETSGWDFDLTWVLPETGFGRFKFVWLNTYVDDYKAVGAAGQVQPRAVGIEVNDSAIPEWTSTAILDWRLGSWTAAYTARHTSDLVEQCGDAAGFPVCSNPVAGTNRLGSVTYHDFQVGYRLDVLRGLQLTAGLNNAFDKDPPICLSCSLNGYDASTYDIPGGRFWYLRADLRF